MNASNQNGYLVSKGYAWYVFSILFMLQLFDFMDRTVIASLYPYLKKAWALSDAQCGALSATVSWSITVFAVPAAVLADRWSRRKTVGLMATIWSLATLACAFTKNYSQLIVARTAIGTGEAGYVPAGNAIISALFPPRLRATLIGLFMGAVAIGSAAGVVVGGFIAVHYGWRHAFGIVGIPGLFFAILFFFTRDYRTVDLTVRKTKNDGSITHLKMLRQEIWKNVIGKPSLLAIYFGQAAGFVFLGAIGSWLPSYFIRIHHLPPDRASAEAGLILVLVIIGNYFGGMIADWIVARGKINARPLVAACLQLANFLVFFSAFALVRGPAQFLLFLLGGVIMGSYNGPIYSAVTEEVHVGLRSTAISVMTLFQNVLGFAMGPILAGLISDRYGLEPAMIVIACAPALSGILYFVAASFYTRDAADVEKVEIHMEN